MIRSGRGRGALVFAAAVALAAGVLAAAEDPCARATSTAVLTAPGEPGTPLHVRGTIFRSDGSTPAAGVILYVYQTDATGHYARRPGEDPRIRGWMRTDARGRFGFRTIRPAPYPNRTEPAHIHAQVWGPKVPPQSPPAFLFADDPLVRAAQKTESAALGQFAFVQSPARGADGVLEVTYEIRLRDTGQTYEDDILHGMKPCGVKP